MISTAVETPNSPTPILDRMAPLPPPASAASEIGGMVVVWFGLFFGLSILFMPSHQPVVRSLTRRLVVNFNQLPVEHWTIVSLLFVVLVAVLVVFIAIAIHELGHVLVGVLVGFRFNSLRIGRLQFDRPFRISLYRGKGTGASGWASMFPVKQDKLVWRAATMIFAGPACNLLSVGVMCLLPFPPGPVSIFFTLFSLILGVLNLLPFRSRAVHSDGSRILMLLLNRAKGERWVALLKLAAELSNGVMPESFSPAYLSKATALCDNSPDTVSTHSLAYSAAFHQHKDAKAAQMLEVLPTILELCLA